MNLTVKLTEAELRAALNAISQQTDGNARSFEEWRQGTSGSRHEWNALIRAEEKLAFKLRGTTE